MDASPFGRKILASRAPTRRSSSRRRVARRTSPAATGGILPRRRRGAGRPGGGRLGRLRTRATESHTVRYRSPWARYRLGCPATSTASGHSNTGSASSRRSPPGCAASMIRGPRIPGADLPRAPAPPRGGAPCATRRCARTWARRQTPPPRRRPRIRRARAPDQDLRLAGGDPPVRGALRARGRPALRRRNAPVGAPSRTPSPERRSARP